MSRAVAASCDHCGRAVRAKELTHLPGGWLCRRCVDKIPGPQRRGLVRRAERDRFRAKSQPIGRFLT